MSNDAAISVQELISAIGTPGAPVLFDVRKPAAFAAAQRGIAGATWRAHDRVAAWAADLPMGAEVVVYCVHGHQVSQAVAAHLRVLGRRARFLTGGFEAFAEASGPTLRLRDATGAPSASGLWLTETGAGVAADACVWCIRRLVDPAAVILFVAPDQALTAAPETGARAFAVDGAEIADNGTATAFQSLLQWLDMSTPDLAALAAVVRTAAGQDGRDAAGLAGVLQGLRSCGLGDDELQRRIVMVFDAVFAEVRGRGPGIAATPEAA